MDLNKNGRHFYVLRHKRDVGAFMKGVHKSLKYSIRDSPLLPMRRPTTRDTMGEDELLGEE